MELNPIYWGLFLYPGYQNQSLYLNHPVRKRPLSNTILDPHITFGRNIPCPYEFVQNMYWVRVTGYGNDGRNEAFSIKIPDVLKEIYHGAPIPHMTIAIAENARPCDSKDLEFKDFDKPWFIPTIFGYYDTNGIHFYRPN